MRVLSYVISFYSAKDENEEGEERRGRRGERETCFFKEGRRDKQTHEEEDKMA